MYQMVERFIFRFFLAGVFLGSQVSCIRASIEKAISSSDEFAPALTIWSRMDTFAGPSGGEGSIDGIGASARFRNPSGITTDGTNLYVTDYGNQTIRKIVIATGVVTTIAGMARKSGSSDGIGTAARFYGLSEVAIVGGNIFIADMDNRIIRKMDTTNGDVTTFAGAAGMVGSADGVGSAARFYGPSGIATDGTNLYVADRYNHNLRKIVIATGQVTTLAGMAGVSGFADGAGIVAQFNSPSKITTDGINLYVTDSDNHIIRKIVIATGDVTTISGIAGVAGNIDGDFYTSQFNTPTGIVTDGTNLYVTDKYNHKVRKVVIATGEVTTIAGGTGVSSGFADGMGSAARFYFPSGITIDGAHLYLTDSYNQTIRKIDIATGAVTTFAGAEGSAGSSDGMGGAARFVMYPSGMTSDGVNLYLLDSEKIRKINIVTGIVTTLGGGWGYADGPLSSALFRYPSGLTTDGTHLYVMDTNNRVIRKIVIATGIVTTFVGMAGVIGSTDGTGSAARFGGPGELTTDGTNIYVADTDNHTIRKIVIATGVVTTLAGTPGAAGSIDGTGSAARFFYPSGITTDGVSLYVAETSRYIVRKIVISTGVVTTIAGTAGVRGYADAIGAAARFSTPSKITTDGTNLYVTDTDNHALRKIVISTGAVSTLLGNPQTEGNLDGTLDQALLSYPSRVIFSANQLFFTTPASLKKIH